jgi:hypothetical protein
MAIHEPPHPSPLAADVEVRVVSTPERVLDNGKALAEAKRY